MSFAQLLQSIDEFSLEEYLLEHNIQPLKSKNAEEWLGPCPKCGKEKLCVDVKKRAFHCWTCQKYEDFWSERDGMMKRRPVLGAGGLIALIGWLDDLEPKDAIAYVAEHSAFGHGIYELPDIRIVEEVLNGHADQSIGFPEGWAPIYELNPYMIKRRITMADVQRLGLVQVVSGRYRNRIVFPVWERGQLLYWQARAMYEAEDVLDGKFIKALNPERMPGCAVSSEVLMNLDVAARYPRVVIVEGPMDALRAGPDAVCTFGKAISSAQVRRLILAGVKAIDLMWDGPKGKEPNGAWAEMIQMAPWLSSFFDVRLVFLPHGDPDEWSMEWLNYYRAGGTPVKNMHRLAMLPP